jgi:hypothetical protein
MVIDIGSGKLTQLNNWCSFISVRVSNKYPLILESIHKEVKDI